MIDLTPDSSANDDRLEENFAIIGANLQLARSIYLLYRKRYSNLQKGSHKGYPPSLNDGRSHFHPDIERASASAKPANGSVESGAIQKTTDLHVVRNDPILLDDVHLYRDHYAVSAVSAV